MVPRRYQSGEIDYTGSISKCGDRRLRTLLYEAANVMLTRYKPPLKLKDWALAIAKRALSRLRGFEFGTVPKHGVHDDSKPARERDPRLPHRLDKCNPRLQIKTSLTT